MNYLEVKSTLYLEYLLVKVLPQYYLLPDLPGMDVKDKLVQLTAELAVHTGNLKEPETAAKNLFDRLIDYLPLPPMSEDGVLHEAPTLEFTKVCLLCQWCLYCSPDTVTGRVFDVRFPHCRPPGGKFPQI